MSSHLSPQFKYMIFHQEPRSFIYSLVFFTIYIGDVVPGVVVYLRSLYIITHHGLGGFSGLINGLIAPAIGALKMLMSEPTAKSNVQMDIDVCPLTHDIYNTGILRTRNMTSSQ